MSVTQELHALAGKRSAKLRRTRKTLIADAAVAIIAAGSSTRDVIAAIREVMRRNTLVICDMQESDPVYVREFMTAMRHFALGASVANDELSACCDCPSLGCNEDEN